MKNLWLVTLYLVMHIPLQAQVITTFAGNTIVGDTLNGVQATAEDIGECYGVATDAAGNVYIANTVRQRIQKVNTAGIITIIAGNGIPGFNGDGGPATNASLGEPLGITIDSPGNIYIIANSYIRKIDTFGIITTIAGSITYGYSGDGGPATAAEFKSPFGIAVDRAGNIYIADLDNHAIRKINKSGIITTIAGNGWPGYTGDSGPATIAQLNQPIAVAVDSIGNVYISDQDGFLLRKINTDGIITTIAGDYHIYGYYGDGGPAISARFFGIYGIAIDSWGNIFLSDQGNNVIRAINTSGIVTTYAGNDTVGYSGDGGFAIHAELNEPYGIAVDASDNLYIADAQNFRIRKVSAPPASVFVKEVQPQGSLQLFPNPSSGQFTIALPAAQDKITLIIEDLLGKTIETKTITYPPQQFHFTLSQPPGTYIVKVITDGNTYWQKVVVW